MFETFLFRVNEAHGTKSSKPSDPIYYTSVSYASNITAILDQEGIKKAHYIGYSLGGYIGCCLLAHCPDRWTKMAIGGWNPEGTMPGFVASMLANTYRQPWMDSKRDKPALKQAIKGCTNAVPNLNEALEACSNGSDGYPQVMLWAGESDMVVGGIRKCAKKYNFPLATTPGSHEHVNLYVAGIPEMCEALLAYLE